MTCPRCGDGRVVHPDPVLEGRVLLRCDGPRACFVAVLVTVDLRGVPRVELA